MSRNKNGSMTSDAEHRFRFGTLAGRSMRDPTAFPGWNVVDVEVIPSLNGEPEGMAVWLIFRTREEAAHAADAADELAALGRAALGKSGFPSQAVPTVRFFFTSEPAIEEGGGRFYFFR